MRRKSLPPGVPVRTCVTSCPARVRDRARWLPARSPPHARHRGSGRRHPARSQLLAPWSVLHRSHASPPGLSAGNARSAVSNPTRMLRDAATLVASWSGNVRRADRPPQRDGRRGQRLLWRQRWPRTPGAMTGATGPTCRWPAPDAGSREDSQTAHVGARLRLEIEHSSLSAQAAA